MDKILFLMTVLRCRVSTNVSRDFIEGYCE